MSVSYVRNTKSVQHNRCKRTTEYTHESVSEGDVLDKAHGGQTNAHVAAPGPQLYIMIQLSTDQKRVVQHTNTESNQCQFSNNASIKYIHP